MEIIGTIGSKSVRSQLDGHSVTIQSKKGPVKFELLFVAFQRVSKRLKTCDVIWVGKATLFQQTIPYKSEEAIRDHWKGAIYDIGLDPGPWKKWHRLSVKENWNTEDWEKLLVPDIEEDESDSDWNPDDEGHDSSDDEGHDSSDEEYLSDD
tara:strand:+ start:237 stop:689 length:453 start_codon:yes stop_codon:yes gene_type:complete